MTRTKLAVMWAASILIAALASSVGLIDDGIAKGLYLGLLIGAGVSLSEVPCGSC
jgi:hypothetical protein